MRQLSSVVRHDEKSVCPLARQGARHESNAVRAVPHAEAAEIMCLSVAAFESLLARGRRAMRARLRPLADALLRGT